MAKNKNLVWIGLGSALVLATGLFFYFRNKSKSEDKTTEEEKTPDTGENPKNNTTNHTPAPKGATYPSTPFTNITEGNKFRAWVNKNYSAYAKKNQLDPTGDYNNDFIRKAFLQYGAEYTKATVPPTVKLPASEFKSGNLIYLAPNVSSMALYSYPENSGSWVKGTISKKDAVDKPIGKFIRVSVQGKTPSATWVKVTIPTYRNVDNAIINTAGDFYVSAINISKTPY